MLIPVLGRMLDKTDAKLLFHQGDEVRAHASELARRCGKFDGGKIGVEKKGQFLRVFLQPGPFFGGELNSGQIPGERGGAQQPRNKRQHEDERSTTSFRSPVVFAGKTAGMTRNGSASHGEGR